VATSHYTHLLDQGKPPAEAYTSGFALAFWVAAGVAAAAILTTLLIVRRRDLQVQPEAVPAVT